MAAINPLARELVLKIVFYGPGLGGKTTTLQHVHDRAKPEHRGKMVSLATAVDRTLYFDFLPIRLPKTRGMNVRLQLFTVPGQVYYNSTRKLVLTGADGIVFVADSQSLRHDANLESLENLQDNLREQKRELGGVPHVIQYNKRDLPDIVSIEDLERTLNLHGARSVSTVATRGEGVFEALSLITEAALSAFNQGLPSQGASSDVRLLLAEGGLADALRGADGPLTGRSVSIVTDNLLDPGRAPRLTNFPEQPELEPLSAIPSSPLADLGPVATSPAAGLALRERATDRPSRRAPGAPADGPNFSFASLWGDGERETVRELESSIALRDHARSVELLETLSTRVLAGAAALLGTTEAPRDPALVPILLGVSGGRYLAFRAMLRDARQGTDPDERAVLGAYAFLIELRLARARVGA